MKNNYNRLRNIMQNNPIDSDKYMDAYDEMCQLSRDNTFEHMTPAINPEGVPDMLKALYDTVSVLDLAILQTPTGLARERLTELNIKVLTAIQKATL